MHVNAVAATAATAAAAGHAFCRACLRLALQHKRQCPKCREAVAPSKCGCAAWQLHSSRAILMLCVNSRHSSNAGCGQQCLCLCDGYELQPQLPETTASFASLCVLQFFQLCCCTLSQAGSRRST
jgi:hypothetical protein